jgi:phosphate transport system substrate-binding protein
MRRTKRTFVVIAFTLVSCSSQLVPAATPTSRVVTLRLYATTATIPLVNELTTTYAQTHPNISFDIATSDYQALINRLMSERNFYFVSNHLPSASPLWGAPVGQDGIAIIAHPDNPVNGLSTQQLREIYQGRIANWREVGGADIEISVVSREDGSGTRAEFERAVMGDRRTTPNAQVASSSAAMVKSVAAQAGAIGYVSMSYVDSTVKALAIDGVSLSRESVSDNSYPLRSTLIVVGLEEPVTDYRAFIYWLQSQEGQAIIARHYAPLLQP